MHKPQSILLFVFVLVAIPSSQAQFLPDLCPPPARWVGGQPVQCQCPDGSLLSLGQTCGSYQAPLGPSVGDYCNDGGTCPVGTRCSWSPGKCVPVGKVDCGNYNCEPGERCAADKRYRACLRADQVDCGSYTCEAGQRCGRRHRACLASGETDCGGYSCGPGTKCSRVGKRCLALDEVDCGKYTCPAGNKCVRGQCYDEAAERSKKEQEQRQLEAERQRRQQELARQEAERQRLQQKLARQEAARQRQLDLRYGSLPNKQLAQKLLPHALMANDVYSNDPRGRGLGTAVAVGWSRGEDWNAILRKGGFTEGQIRLAERVGFFATTYRNTRTGEIVIAYRGTDQKRDWPGANLNAWMGTADLQHKFAADVAFIVKHFSSKGAPISLTGHSLGGELASYAGEQTGITSVYTYNAARGRDYTNGYNAHQMNVVVPGDAVGDSTNWLGRLTGSGRLAGQQYRIDPTTGNRNPGAIEAIVVNHDLTHIIAGLSDIAR